MGKIKINKIEAARRQIDAAIRMLFQNEDPVAIHTIVMAAFRILRDLHEKNETIKESIHKSIKAIIRPDMEKEFWSAFQGFSNFLKHADRDPDEISGDIDEQVNDLMLWLCCNYFRDLGYQYTPEMASLVTWYMVLHPNYWNDNMSINDKRLFSDIRITLTGKSRQEQLKEGMLVLEVAHSKFRRY